MPNMWTSQVIGHAANIRRNTTSTGKTVNSCSVAINDPQGWKKRQVGQNEDPPTWIEITWWGDFEVRFAAGDLIAAAGNMAMQHYTTRDGSQASKLTLQSDKPPVRLSTKKTASDPVGYGDDDAPKMHKDLEDDLPF